MADVLQVHTTPFPVTLTGTVTRGEPLGYDGNGWARADANAYGAGNSLLMYARAIALGSGISGDTIMAAERADLQTTGLTAGSPVYLSETAGAVTQTRPTTSGSLRQNLGTALNTERWQFRPALRTIEVPLVHVLEYSGGEGALGSRVALDSGLFEGYQLNAQNEYITFGATLPDNVIAITQAEIRAAAEAAGSRTVSISVGSAAPDLAHDAVTADTSESAKTITVNGATDPINLYDMSAAFNAAGLILPGATLAVKLLAADAGVDAILIFGGRLLCLVAD